MKSNYKALSELIEKVDERNADGAITELIGVSIDKCFIKSVANTNGTDLSKYKIIRKNEFAVSLMQVSRDSKIPIARLEDYDVAIMSPAYPIFRVKDTSVVLPNTWKCGSNDLNLTEKQLLLRLAELEAVCLGKNLQR